MIEKTADQIEMASQIQEKINEQGLALVRAAGGPQKHPDFDGEHCVDCEDDLPPVRIAYGRIRCTPCQTAAEQAAKRRK